MDNKGFSERLSELLKEKNMTRADLARFFNTSQSTVFSWFRQGYKPSLDYALKLSTLFNVNVEWLATGEGERIKDMNTQHEFNDTKYQDINRIWDMLSDEKKKEFLSYGSYLVNK